MVAYNNRHLVRFGAKMAALRGDIPQKFVSDKLGYKSAQFISNIERGVAPMPLSMVRPFARAIGVSPAIVYKHWIQFQVDGFDAIYRRYLQNERRKKHVRGT